MNSITFTKYVTKLDTIQLLKWLSYLALLCPIFVISAPLAVFLVKPYIGYLIFFSAFYTLLGNLAFRTTKNTSTKLHQRIFSYIWIIFLGLCLIYGLDSLAQQSSNKTLLFLSFAICTLSTLIRNKKIQDSVLLLSLTQITCYTLLIYTGFESLNFPARTSAWLYSFALAMTFTSSLLGHHLVELSHLTAEQVPEVRTRKQRRKFRNLFSQLESETGWRWIAIALLLLGPSILVTMSMTTFFPSYYGLIAFLFLLPREFLVNLPVKGRMPILKPQFAKDWVLFCYLLAVVLLLLRLVFA